MFFPFYVLYQTDVFSEQISKDFLREIFHENQFIIMPFTAQDVLNPNSDFLKTVRHYGMADFYIRGSVPAYRTILKERYSKPHIPNYFDCDVWVSKLKKYVLNSDYVFADLERIREIFLQEVNSNDRIFIRPNKGTKTFSGCSFNLEELNLHIAYLEQRNVKPEDVFCLFSSYKKIQKEYRLIYINREFVSGSLYMEDDKINIQAECPQYVIDYANEIAKHEFLAHEVIDYCLDIAIFEDRPYLLEINSIHTSSFYEADLKKVYQAIKKSFDNR